MRKFDGLKTGRSLLCISRVGRPGNKLYGGDWRIEWRAPQQLQKQGDVRSAFPTRDAAVIPLPLALVTVFVLLA